MIEDGGGAEEAAVQGAGDAAAEHVLTWKRTQKHKLLNLLGATTLSCFVVI